MAKVKNRLSPRIIYTGIQGVSPKASILSKRLNRTARKRKKRLYSIDCAENASGRYRGTGEIRFRKHRAKGPTTKLRTKERSKGFDDYVVEVHLKSEHLEHTVRVQRGHYPPIQGAKGTSAFFEHRRKPGTRRRWVSRFVAKDSVFTGEHEKIVEHLKLMMPVRARRVRVGRQQRTRLYFQSESDFTILKTLYAEHVWKAYRLIDKVDA